jgi:tRNA1Val (adenine37-N6)-methyltransferase
MPNTSVDAFLNGKVLLAQPKSGYRVNVDSVHLANFSARKPARHVCDLGAGVGAVGLMVHALAQPSMLTMIERDGAMYALLETNAKQLQDSCAVSCLHRDVASLAAGELAANLVVMNPPYFSKGRISPASAKASARFGELAPFLEAARRSLAKGGRLTLVYPAQDLTDTFAALRASGFEPKELQLVHASPAHPARVALIAAQPAKAGGLSILPATFDREDDPA